MGAWGPGLHSDDFAADLKPALSTVCRLPLDGEEIVSLLVDLHPVAEEKGDEDYTTFWLVVADGLQKRGIASTARERALGIIDDGSDLKLLADLGMSESDLRKRRKVLDDLRDRLTAPLPDKERRVLKKPQPLLVNPGEVYAYQVDSQGNVYNPYFTDPATARFEPVAWDCCVVVRSGHAFDYLAWYQIARSAEPTKEPRTLDQAVAAIDFAWADAGTLPRNHITRMNLDLLGTTDLPAIPPPPRGRILSVVASDISASNILSRYRPPGTFG